MAGCRRSGRHTAADSGEDQAPGHRATRAPAHASQGGPTPSSVAMGILPVSGPGMQSSPVHFCLKELVLQAENPRQKHGQ